MSRRLLVPLLFVACSATQDADSALPVPSPDAGVDGGNIEGIDDVETLPLWRDATSETLATKTRGWTNKVDLADVDGDGTIDVLFANGGDYDTPGNPEATGLWLNIAPGKPLTLSNALGDVANLARVVKARDLDGDGLADVIIGNTYRTQSRIFMNRGKGILEETTATSLPSEKLSVGDLEIGDIDGDGDLDLVMVDWGAGDPFGNSGGRVHLWKNDGRGKFTDASAQMPTTSIRFSWDMELADVDDDGDLDVLVASKVSEGSFLFLNDGQGTFEDVSKERLPQFTNNYEFEAMDLDGDGALDLVTLNDGDPVSTSSKDEANRREHIFLNDGRGTFRDMTATLWPNTSNIGKDDNAAVFLDYDSDGDADVLIGSLTDPDRILVNDGKGKLSLLEGAFDGTATPGTLGIGVADLDGDKRLDVVMGQGESAFDERIYLGVGIKRDIAPPSVTKLRTFPSAAPGKTRVLARVHDRKTPVTPWDFKSVVARVTATSGNVEDIPMVWMGEALFRAEIPAGSRFEVCAVDRAGNRKCAAP